MGIRRIHGLLRLINRIDAVEYEHSNPRPIGIKADRFVQRREGMVTDLVQLIPDRLLIRAH